MQTWYIVSLFIHILAAMTFVGGMLFLVMVLVPTLRAPEVKAHAGVVMSEAARRFGRVGAASVVVLILTGLTNAYFKGFGAALMGSDFWSTPYAHLFGGKFIIALVIAFLSLQHVGKAGKDTLQAMQVAPAEEATARLRRRSALLGRVNLVLALIAILFGLLLSRGI